jgi:nitric oxide reductase NorQ protein
MTPAHAERPANQDGLQWPAAEAPFFLPAGNEIDVFDAAHRSGLPVMLKGPTGCGKTRFVEHMAWRLGRPLITVACHDDLSASDLTGRYLIRGGETVWLDGPLTQAARVGAICYLDEIVEARQDTVVVIHPLTDDRRMLPIEKTGEIIDAAPGFQLVISYNPGYQHGLKDLKPSTRQRFVALEFEFPAAPLEADIVAHESGVPRDTAVALVTLTNRLRQLGDRGLAEVPSTRLIVATGRLVASGISLRDACRSALLGPLTDDPDLLAAMHDLVTATM